MFRKIEAERKELNKELLKLVPEKYKITILPTFFNYTDPERIRTIISD